MYKKRITAFKYFCILLFFFCIPQPAFAATYYVAGDVGSDAYTSVQAQNTSTPWKTIQKAADTMVAGDTVNVKGNITYNDNVTCQTFYNSVVCPANSGAAGNYITYQAWPGTGIPTIDASGRTAGFFITSSRSYLTISGFAIHSAGINGGSGTLANIYTASSHLRITNNLIYGSSSYGIWAIAISSDVLLYNNTVVNNSGEGIAILDVGNSCEIKNNIITGNNVGISKMGGNPVSINYNLVYGNNSGDYDGFPAGSNDISVDPLFVDLTDNDFHLRKTSPAINAGTTIASVTTDIMGVPRPQGSTYDIGAYEFYDIPTSFTSIPSTPMNNTNPMFFGTASTDLPGASITSIIYSIDGGWETNGITGSSSFTIVPSTLSQGNHTIRVRATDSYGNFSDPENYATYPFAISTTAPSATWITPTGDTRTFSSTAPEVLYTDNTLPFFSFVKAQDTTVGMQKYQILLNDHVYIDDIPANQIYIDNQERYIRSEIDTIQVQGKSEKYQLPMGGYWWKVRAVNTAGNTTDTKEKILLIRSHRIDKTKTYFPLIILTIGGNPQFISTDQITRVPKNVWTSTKTPTFYGITTVGSTVSLTMLQKDKTIVSLSSKAGIDSRYTIPMITKLGTGTYIVRLSVTNDARDYVELPEFTLWIP
jgi:parallel beta-helix repeat protein